MIVVNIRASQFEKRCFNLFLMIVHFIFQFPILANLIHAEMEELADLKEEKISLAIVRYLSLDQLVARVRNITIQLTYFSRSAYPGRGGGQLLKLELSRISTFYDEG